VTPELLTRIGGRKPSGSAATSDDLLTGSVVETVDQVLGAVGEFRKVVSAAGAIVCRIGVRAANSFCVASCPGDVF
jgi:hypothetical protein